MSSGCIFNIFIKCIDSHVSNPVNTCTTLFSYFKQKWCTQNHAKCSLHAAQSQLWIVCPQNKSIGQFYSNNTYLHFQTNGQPLYLIPSPSLSIDKVRTCSRDKQRCHKYKTYTSTSVDYSLLTSWSRVLHKITGSRLFKKFPTFYGTRSFITAFTSARRLFLS